MKDDLIEQVIEAHKRSYHRAFETAVRAGTALIFEKDGKIVKVKPPYRYELVPIEPASKHPNRQKRTRKSNSC